MRFIPFFLEKLAQTFSGWSFCCNHRVLANAIGILFEYIFHKIRFDISFYGIVIIANYLTDIAAFHILLKLIIRSFFVD